MGASGELSSDFVLFSRFFPIGWMGSRFFVYFVFIIFCVRAIIIDLRGHSSYIPQPLEENINFRLFKPVKLHFT